jgi:hypothetical protein
MNTYASHPTVHLAHLDKNKGIHLFYLAIVSALMTEVNRKRHLLRCFSLHEDECVCKSSHGASDDEACFEGADRCAFRSCGVNVGDRY